MIVSIYKPIDFRLPQRKVKLPIIIKKVKSRLRRVIANLAILAYNSKSIIATEVPFSHSQSHIVVLSSASRGTDTQMLTLYQTLQLEHCIIICPEA